MKRSQLIVGLAAAALLSGLRQTPSAAPSYSEMKIEADRSFGKIQIKTPSEVWDKRSQHIANWNTLDTRHIQERAREKLLNKIYLACVGNDKQRYVKMNLDRLLVTETEKSNSSSYRAGTTRAFYIIAPGATDEELKDLTSMGLNPKRPYFALDREFIPEKGAIHIMEVGHANQDNEFWAALDDLDYSEDKQIGCFINNWRLIDSIKQALGVR